MSRPTLRILAVILTTLIIVVLVNAFDHLPGSVRTQIESERGALASAQGELKSAQDTVARETQAQASFFAAIAASRQWPGMFQNASGTLQSAGRDMDELSRLEKQGHYRDRQQAESLLADERRLRTAALGQASSVQSEAAHWLSRKQQLPGEVEAMQRDYQAIHAYDLAPLAATIEHAETDWPEKKPDLEARLASVRGIVTHGDELWQSTAAGRAAAAAGKIEDSDAGTLLVSEDELKASAAALPKQAGELQSRAGQLYDSWDKILVDMEVRGFGSSREYDQKIRTVRTHAGSTTSEERWSPVSQATYDSMHNDLGMAIEQKPAGKYDSEADHVPQPAGFAYVAPPTQGSNQYGHWEQHDGHSFWVFYGQYALLRDLLFNRSYRPLDRRDWEGYRTERSQGHTYYGQNAESSTNAPKYGTNGTTTQERYSGSSYAKGGGFRDSEYASRSGSYRNSPYASPAARDQDADRSPKTFGRNPRSGEPHAAPPPEHSYHPAPRPAPRHIPSGGGGRRFGRRGR
jgi:hypothetical protein